MRTNLTRRFGVIALGSLMGLLMLFFIIQAISSSTVHAQVGGCSTLTPIRPFVYANPDIIQNGETGVCSETQPTVNGETADFGGYGPYSWSVTEAVSGVVLVEEGTMSATVDVAQLMPTTTVSYASADFLAGPYPISVVAYRSETANGVVTATFQVTGWQWNFFPAAGRTVWFWSETTGTWQSNAIWDDEYQVMAFVGPVLNEVCNEILPEGNWVFANPDYLHGSELGACADEQVTFNAVLATLIADSARPYNWVSPSKEGNITAVVGNEIVEVVVNQVPLSETLVVSGATFIANETFGMSVVAYEEVSTTETITNVYQVSGWAWNFAQDSNVTVQYWDYTTGSWSLVPAWRDHMIMAFTKPAPQPQDPTCYTQLPAGYNVFANPSYLNSGETGACSDTEPTFNGYTASLIENSTLPYNWGTLGLTGTVTVSSSQGITDVVINQVAEGEILSTGVVTFEAPINSLSVVSYTMQEDSLFKYHRYQVTGWQYNYVEGANVWGGFYWDWTDDVWHSLPVPGDRWKDQMIFEFREAKSPETSTFNVFLPIISKSAAQVAIVPVKDTQEHVQSFGIDGETDFNFTFPANGEFDWSVGLWTTNINSVNVTYKGQTINVNWVLKGDHYEADPFWQSQGPVQAGATFKIHIEEGTWINLGYRYR